MIMYVHLPELFKSHPEISEIRIVPDSQMSFNLGKDQVKDLAQLLQESVTKKKKPSVTWSDFLELWSAACDRNPSWIRVTARNKDLQKRFSSASKEFTTKDEWALIIKGMENDPFFSGKSGVYDRPKALTIFYSGRYFNFYESALEINQKTPEDSIDSFLDSLRGA